MKRFMVFLMFINTHLIKIDAYHGLLQSSEEVSQSRRFQRYQRIPEIKFILIPSSVQIKFHTKKI